jgi:hypothetical protein
MLMVMVMVMMLATSQAAPVGDPVPRLATGRLAVGARLEGASQWLQVEGCEETADACDGVWRRSGIVGVGRVTLLEGLGLDVEVGRLTDRIQQAGYSGQGLMWALGARGGVPLSGSGWWLGGVARYEAGLADNDQVGEDLAESRYSIGTASGLLVWSPLQDAGFSCWVGGQGAWRWSHTITPLGVDEDNQPILEVQTSAGLPVAAVAGLSIISEPLGAPWQPAWRIGIELDGTVGQTNLVSAQALVRF